MDNSEPSGPLQCIGYWYAGKDELRVQAPGHIVANAVDGPPWLVIDRSILSVIVTGSKWPGRLWRARVVLMGDMSELVAEPGYWRASKIELIEELPLAALFGPNGARIFPLFSQIMALSAVQAERLQAAQAGDAKAAWKRWSQGLRFPRTHHYGCDEGMTLASPGNRDREMSPANYAFSLIYDLIRQRAAEVEGRQAFIDVVENGETETILSQKWHGACEAYLQAAMAFSMSSLLSADEYAALLRAWTAGTAE